jgi:hypothetical protein
VNDNDKRIRYGIKKNKHVEIVVDDEKVLAFEGESVAAALIGAGKRIFRKSDKLQSPRGLYCGIGQCQECRTTIDDIPDTLACQTFVAHGMKISTKGRVKDR